jgi:methyl-accepting chemotaxis protein
VSNGQAAAARHLPHSIESSNVRGEMRSLYPPFTTSPIKIAYLDRAKSGLGAEMLKNISVNTLLKSVIATLGAAIVVMLSLSAWDSWNRLQTANRIAAVADVSGYLFTTLHNMRVDRASGFRDLQADKQLTAMNSLLVDVRRAEMPALYSASKALDAVDFPERAAFATDLAQRIKRLETLHEESAAAFLKPKAQRRPGLAEEYFKEIDSFIEMLDKLSTRLVRLIVLQDAFVDQLMEVKQFAWIVRNAGGDASVIVSNTLAGQPLPADALLKYTANVSKLETAWAALEDIAAAIPMPASFTAALNKAKQDYFASDYPALRTKAVKALIAGEPPGVTVEQWSPMSVAKLASLLGVAEAALDAAKAHAGAQYWAALWKLALQLSLLVLAVALAAGLMLMVSRLVTGPLRQIRDAMLKLAGGDFEVVLPGLDRGDEIGAVANAAERFKVLAFERARGEADELVRRQQAEAKMGQAEAEAQAKAAEERAQAAEEQARALRSLGIGLSKLSDGDFTFRLNDEIPQAYREIKDDFNTAIGRLHEVIQAVADSTREVAGAAGEISSATGDLSNRIEQQAASLEETSASMEEISATVKANADNAQQANQLTNGTRTVADRGGKVVAEAVKAMSRIEESSRQISDIIGVIDEIARQTNLLALNAAVEAARAGDAGRGFAVVASEVRSLAQRSSEAAKNIKDLIANSSERVQEGVGLVNRAGTALTEIVESINKVADIVADIANASAEQSTGLEQVNQSLTQMDEVTQQNTALVGENTATAKTLAEQSHAMSERIAFFRLDAADMPSPAVAKRNGSRRAA